MSRDRTGRKCLAAGLALIMTISVLSAGGRVERAYAAGEWIGIRDAAGLKAIKNDLSGRYKLLGDIDLNGESWTPIGSSTTPFTGQLDGNSKVIKNFKIDDTTGNYQGLFSSVGAAGEIRNLGVEGASITAGDYTGILTGENSGIMNRCYVKGSVSGNNYVGGLAGSNKGQILDSFASASVSGRNYMGGLAGSNSGTVTRTYSSSTIKPSVFNNYLQFDGTDDYISIPHLAAYVTGTFTLEAWFQWDDVNKALSTDPNNYVDFIIGKGVEHFEIHTEGGSGRNGLRFIPIPRGTTGDSYLDVHNVLQPGWFHVAASYSYDAASKKAKASLFLNGVAQDIWINGVNVGTVATISRTQAPVVSTENINIGRRTDGSYPFKGKIADVRFWNVVRTQAQIEADKNRQLSGSESGLIGYWKLDEGSGTTAADSSANKNTGTVHGTTWMKETAATLVGGLVGYNTGTVSDSYYDSDVSGKSDTGKGDLKTTNEMCSKSTYSTWNFDTVWGIASGTNGGYPYLLPAPGKLSGLTAQKGDTTVRLTWNSVARATEYRIYRSTVSGSYGTALTTVGAITSYIARGLTNGTTYYFVVSAANTSGESPASSEASATPQAPATYAGAGFIPFVPTGGSISSGSGEGQFNFPMGIATDRSGNVYVTESGNSRVQKFDSKGNFLAKWGSSGTGDGQFNAPKDIAVDSSGNVYVTDGNGRVQKFDSDGTFLAKWGSFGTGNGQFNYPFGIAVDGGGNVYVTDSARIQKFDTNGNFLAQWGGSGTGDGQFRNPTGIAIDSGGSIYVADSTNNRIQKFDSSGSFLTKWGSSGTGDGQFNGPCGVTIDSAGNVYVVDGGNNRVQKFDSNGTFLAMWGGVNSQFYLPKGAASDADGNVYVVDYSNQRIQTLAPILEPTSTVKGRSMTGFGIPSLKPGSADPGTVSLTPVQAADITGLAPYETLFDKGGANAAVKVVKYAAGSNTDSFNTDAAYAGEAVSMGDFFLVRLTSADTGRDVYYKINAFVVPVVKTAVAGSNKVSVSWNAVAGATGYRLFYGKSSNWGTRPTYKSVSASVCNYDITGLTNGTPYYFAIKSIYNGSYSDYSDAASATPVAAPELQASVISGGHVKLSWNTVTGATAYSIHKGTASGSYGEAVATVNGSNYEVTGLDSGAAYYFVVKAVNSSGKSDVSNEVSVTIPPAPPALTSVAAGDGHAKLTWSPVPGAEEYKIYASTAAGVYYAPATTAGGAVYSCDVTGLANGTAYYFSVKATNAGGDSAYSNEIAATPYIPVSAPGAPVLKSADAGDKYVTLTWDPVPGATEYKIYASTAAGAYYAPATTAAGAVYSCDVTGLTNGTAYYFAVKATNAGGDSAYSNEIAATPHIPVSALGTPVLKSADAGDKYVTLTWDPVPGATEYKIYASMAAGVYYAPATTAAGAVYSCDVTGLTNGTVYHFAVKATNAGGDSAYSNEIAATPHIPVSVPGAPTDVSAIAGDKEATVSFNAPEDNGGSPITGYIVTSSPGNITATGTGTAIKVTGLSNGTSYTFTVKAVNAAGTGPASTASNAVTPRRPVSDDSDSDDTASPAQLLKPGIDILVNGQREAAATAVTTKKGDLTVTTVIIDGDKAEASLNQAGSHAVLTIPVEDGSDIIVGTLNGQTVKNMEARESVLEIKTGSVTYTLPAAEINIDDVSRQIGSRVELRDIKVSITISKSPRDTVKIVEDTARGNGYQVVVRPVGFEITCSSGNKTVEVSRFNSYIARTIAIPDGIDPGRITTGVILNADGTFSHVPTSIVIIDGKYYVKINSLTNSIYSVIYNPKTFKDVEKHWARDAINDMASRLVVVGSKDDRFEPDGDITRAEFVSTVVKALGLLRQGTGKNIFPDVSKEAHYYDAVSIAHEYGIISGYGNGKFGPDDKMTREQAMITIAKAMKITRLEAGVAESDINRILSDFTDRNGASAYAETGIAACVKTGIISGKSRTMLAPKDSITRAETAVVIRRLLQKSGLI